MLALRFAWFWIFAASPVSADAPLAFVPPAFLTGPTISRSATGNTYSYRGAGTLRATELRLTVVEIPSELSPTDPAPCVDAFIAELRRTLPSLFVSRGSSPLRLGPLTAELWRWTSASEDGFQTGVVSCAIHRNRYIVAAFHDRITDAPQTFPAIRDALIRLNLQ